MWLWTNICLVEVTWKRNFSINEKLRVRVKRRLLNVEDWKLLLTPKRLFGTCLISNLPQNKRKKEKKGNCFLSGYPCCFMQRFTNFSFSFAVDIRNMSSIKRTLAEIAKALIKEISDEEVEPHSKKQWWAVQKTKADEKKKDKQHAASVCNVLSQNKNDRAGNSYPLYILPPTSSSTRLKM